MLYLMFFKPIMHINSQDKLFNIVFKNNNYKHLKNKSIFITGGTGFLGKWILRSINFINKKYNLNIKVYLLIRNKGKACFIKKLLEDTNLEFIKGDLINFKFKKVIILNCFLGR